MPIMFHNLREQLIQYKEADGTRRQDIMDAAIREINHLPATVSDNTQAAHIAQIMAYTATLINYGNALHSIEHQDFFDILSDFKMPAMFDKAEFAALKDYFEFHPAPPAPKMRLKKPIDEIPTPIWQLFREAQKAQLVAKGTAHKFNLDELDILNPPKDQLYPLPMQMMGKYENGAVDRTSANSRGEYRFSKRNGFYLLPGGGMIEIDLTNTLDIKLYKMLDEHLEEEQANLWTTAAEYYNKIDRKLFIEAMETCIENTPMLEDIHPNLRSDLLNLISERPLLSNAAILADVIEKINPMNFAESIASSDRVTLETRLANLRAAVQVETFKLTDLYKQAFDHIKSNTIVKQIEQFGDTRACGGKQISYSGLMTGQPLEEWFKEKLSGAEGELGDDLTGSTIERLTLLQALSKFNTIKFSHLLIVLANQLECYHHKTLDINSSWDKQQYDDARIALMIGASHVAELEKASTTVNNQNDLNTEENAYQSALRALTKRATACDLNNKMKQHLIKLLAEIRTLKASGDEHTAALTQALTETNALLDGSLAPTAYEQTAKTMQGYPSQGMRVIGGIMLAISLIAIGIALAGIFVPIAAATAGTYALTSAVCFFSSRQQGLSKAMSQLAHDKVEEERSITTPAG